MNCRGIYATQEIRTDVITELSKKHSNFKRDKSFFIGAARQHMDVKQIKSFENNYPQPPDVGERFYIGTPLGIQPCFYFNLKPAQSGENVLLVGNNQEKRIAILKSILSCAGRYGYIIKILASKAAQLYRQNKDFFNSLTQAEVITSFPEICKFVGENANRLKSMYSDDEDFEIEAANDKELVIFIGLDEIYAQMEANPLSQKSAWTVFTPATGTPATLAVITPAPSITSNSVSLSTQTTEVETVSVPDTIDEGLAAGISRIDNLLASLDDDDDSPVSATLSVPEKFSGTSSSGIKGYNAIHDLAVFFSDGWKIGINSMVVVDRGTVFGKMRQVKLDGNFNHRIALVMSPEEAQGFMAKTKTMKALIDANDSISAVYEYLGGREQCFRPYVFD